MPRTPLTGRDVDDGSIKHNDLDLSGTTIKTSPVAADYFVVVDSAAPTVLKMVSFTEASKFFVPYTGATADVNLGTSRSLTARQITSTIATGTPPFVVASTTAVTNLNADYLDGQHGSYYTGYVQARGMNLVSNGSGLMGSNYNFSSLTFDQIDVHGGLGSFTGRAMYSHISNENIPVDPTKYYQFSLWAKAGNADGSDFSAGNSIYLGLVERDIDGWVVQHGFACKITGAADTELALPLNIGDTSITLLNGTGWGSSGTGLHFVWFPYTNSKGYTYPDYGYSRNHTRALRAEYNTGTYTNRTANVLTLAAPWPGPNLTAGTHLRQASGSTGSYKYCLAAAANLPNYWTKFATTMKPAPSSYETDTYALYNGTAYVNVLVLTGYGTLSVQKISDVWFSELSANNLDAFKVPITSTVATGNSPFVIASSTVVPNLNADLLDGNHASYFQVALTNPVTGTGTANYLTKFTATSSVGNSIIYDNGTNIGIGLTNPVRKLHIVSSNPMRLEGASNQGIEMLPGASYYSWLIASQYNVANALEFTPSTTIGGTSFSTPVMVIKQGGKVGIGLTSPTALLHLKAGTAAAGTAPLKIDVGTLLTTPEVGAIETNGANIYYTAALNNRRRLAYADEITGGSVLGSGTTGYLPYWLSSNELEDSIIFYDPVNNWVGINTTSPTHMLTIYGGDNYGEFFRVGDGLIQWGEPSDNIYFRAYKDDGLIDICSVSPIRVGDLNNSQSNTVLTVDPQSGTISLISPVGVGIGTDTPQGNIDFYGSYGSQFLLNQNVSILGLGDAAENWEGLKIEFDGGSPSIYLGSGSITGNGHYLKIDDNEKLVSTDCAVAINKTTATEMLDVAGNVRASKDPALYYAKFIAEAKVGAGFSATPASFEFVASGIGTNDGIKSGDVLGRIKAIGMTSGAGVQDGPYIDFRAKADWTGSTYSARNSEIAFFAPSAYTSPAMVVNYRGIEINPDQADSNFAIHGDTYSNVFCMKASVDSIGLMTNAPTSLLHVMGSMATRVVTVSTSGGYTLGSLDSTLLVTYNGASSTITLPAADDCIGRIYTVKNFTGTLGGQDVIISRAGTDQIMTSSLENSVTITNGKTALFQSAGSGKWIHLGTIQK